MLKLIITILCSISLTAGAFSIPRNNQDVTLKMVKCDGATVNGKAMTQFKVPPAGRYITGGAVFFKNPTAGDWATAFVIDKDNILGYGANTVVGSFTEFEVDPNTNKFKGWFIPPNAGELLVEQMIGLDFLLGGLYLEIDGYKADPNDSDMMYVNVKWGAAK